LADFTLAHKKANILDIDYSNNPNKADNYFDGVLIGSNQGITPELFYRHLDTVPTVEDIINISSKTSMLIYKHEFWNCIQGDLIKNQSVALLLYDTIVNEGYYFTKSSVKKALESQGYTFLGFSANQINSCEEEDFFYSIVRDRLDKYSLDEVKRGKFYIKKLFKITFISRGRSKKYLYLATLLLIILLFFLHKSITL
jgi:hypothetical protein